MYSKLKAHNFFVTTLDDVINDTDVTGTLLLTDKTVNGITLEDGNYMFWLLVWLNAPTELEIFRITNVTGKTLTFDKRISPNGLQSHSSWDLAQCNDMWEFMNMLSDNIDIFWYTETIAWTGNELKVKVYWGRVENPSGTDIVMSDTTLTLSNNTDSYIYFDDWDNTLKVAATEPDTYKLISKVTTLSWAITSIEDYRAAKIIPWVTPIKLTQTEINALTNVRPWTIVQNETTGENQQYIGGSRYPIAAGSTQPRMSETVEWRARLATDAEYITGNDFWVDWAPLVPTVSQVKYTWWDWINITSNDIDIDTSDDTVFTDVSTWISGAYKSVILNSDGKIDDTLLYWNQIQNLQAWENINVSWLTVASLLPDGKIYKLSWDKRNLWTCPWIKTVILNDTQCVSFVRSSWNIYWYVWTISWNSVTFWTQQSIVTNNTSDNRSVCKLESNKLLLVYHPSSTVVYAVWIDLTGTTLTAWSPLTLLTSSLSVNQFPSLCNNIDTNKWIMLWAQNASWIGEWFSYAICSISWTTLTKWTTVDVQASYADVFKNLTTYWNKFAMTVGENQTYDFSYIIAWSINWLTISSWNYIFPVVNWNNREYNYNTPQKIFFNNNWTTLYLWTNAGTYAPARVISFTLSWTTLTRWTNYSVVADWATAEMIILDRIIWIWDSTTIKWYTKDFNLISTNSIWLSVEYIANNITDNYVYVSGTFSWYLYKISNELFFRYGIIKESVLKDAYVNTYIRWWAISTTGLIKWWKYFINYDDGSLSLDYNNTSIEAWLWLETTKLYISM